ncbi:MAG: hypothetical protein QXU03_00830 [Desulfurococcaceae archaeon]
MLRLGIANVCIEVEAGNPAELLRALESSFTRRYLPTVNLNVCSSIAAKVYWLPGKGFQVLSATFSSMEPDTYVVQGEYPEAYVNEPPVFFLVQVFARSLAKEGYIMLTDSVALRLNNKNVLLLGFPHTGKSTMSSIALSLGYEVYSTENTVVKANDAIYIITGTRVLVFDPRVRELYGVTVKSTSKTKHGYEVVDLDALIGHTPHDLQVPVDELYVIYTSFNSSGVSTVPVKGRKIDKLLWYFATSLIKGMDYYYPQPLDMPMDSVVAKTINDFMNTARRSYAGKFYEVFGSPLEVLKAIAS